LPAPSVHELQFSSNNVSSRSHSFVIKQYGVTSINSALSPGQRCVNDTCRSMFGCSTTQRCVLTCGDGLQTEPLKPQQQARAIGQYLSTEQMTNSYSNWQCLMYADIRKLTLWLLTLKSQREVMTVNGSRNDEASAWGQSFEYPSVLCYCWLDTGHWLRFYIPLNTK